MVRWPCEKPLAPVEILNFSGLALPRNHGSLPVLKPHCFRRVDAAVTGDAPKDVLKIYCYERDSGYARKVFSNRWPVYIAKVGHKWYPNESLTEQLFTEIGLCLKVQVASSKLLMINGQLRFLSRYFLHKDEMLIHGADLFSTYLEDESFVKAVEQEDNARKVFTFQVVEESLRSLYPEHADKLLQGLAKLLAFDAIVGNMDRHYYNWGIVVDPLGIVSPRFAPIFDTARGLFWNYSEKKIIKIVQSRGIPQTLNKYMVRCRPKTGWDGMESPDHFDLVEKLSNYNPEYRRIFAAMAAIPIGSCIEQLFAGKLRGLFSPERQELILQCIDRRCTEFASRLN